MIPNTVHVWTLVADTNVFSVTCARRKNLHGREMPTFRLTINRLARQVTRHWPKNGKICGPRLLFATVSSSPLSVLPTLDDAGPPARLTILLFQTSRLPTSFARSGPTMPAPPGSMPTANPVPVRCRAIRARRRHTRDDVRWRTVRGRSPKSAVRPAFPFSLTAAKGGPILSPFVRPRLDWVR